MAAQSKTDLVLASVRRLLRVVRPANLLNLLQKRHPSTLPRSCGPSTITSGELPSMRWRPPTPLAVQVVAELGVDMGAASARSRRPVKSSGFCRNLRLTMPRALIDRFPEPLADEVRELMRGQRPTAEVAEVLQHREGTAGRIMNPGSSPCPKMRPPAEAVNAIQQLGGVEMSFYLYVIDERRHLVGVVSPPASPPCSAQARLKDIMTTDVISVGVDTPEEEVARKSRRITCSAVPSLTMRTSSSGP
jgi:magnesium transporter